MSILKNRSIISEVKLPNLKSKIKIERNCNLKIILDSEISLDVLRSYLWKLIYIYLYMCKNIWWIFRKLHKLFIEVEKDKRHFNKI